MAMRSFLRSRRALPRSLLQPDLLRDSNPNYVSRPLVPAVVPLRSYSHASEPTTKNPIRDAAADERSGFKSSLNPIEVAKFAALAETWSIFFYFTLLLLRLFYFMKCEIIRLFM